jgi:hypothetical protein
VSIAFWATGTYNYCRLRDWHYKFCRSEVISWVVIVYDIGVSTVANHKEALYSPSMYERYNPYPAWPSGPRPVDSLISLSGKTLADAEYQYQTTVYWKFHRNFKRSAPNQAPIPTNKAVKGLLRATANLSTKSSFWIYVHLPATTGLTKVNIGV